VLPEPFATQALLKNGAIRMPIDLRKEWQALTGHADYPMSILVMRSERIAAFPIKTRTLMNSYRASVEKALQAPEPTAALAESLDLGVTAQVASVAIPKSNFVFIEAPQAIPEIEALLTIFLNFDPTSVGGTLPDRSFYAAIP